MKKINLKDKIFDDSNIYAAIYSLKSYINEPNLLDDEDYELFCQLQDHYNYGLIGKIIKKCKTRLSEFYHNDLLFKTKIYFKLKGCKDNNFVFRPIHTCDLITQICLVAMLQPIMFKDGKNRRYSDVSHMMPNNFFGNMPSTNVDFLYQKWQEAYKSYSDQIINKTREYQENNKYSREVSLDLVDFFPSVNPGIIIYDLKKRCESIYEDLIFFEKTLIKLLYFEVERENLRGWEELYYPDVDVTLLENSRLTSRGIPQGLPQAPFFGNLIMTKIERILREKIEGDALYYVDDSVIFSNVTEDEFQKFLGQDLNRMIYGACGLESAKAASATGLCVPEALCEKYSNIQKEITYNIRFHEAGKSYLRPISESYNTNGSLGFLRRQVSQAGPIFRDTDEFEDSSSLEKIKIICEMIGRTISSMKKYVKKDKDSYNEYKNKLKLLRRHLRFFKFRLMVLELREQGKLTPKDTKDFKDKLEVPALYAQAQKEQFMEQFDEDIFVARYRLFLNLYTGGQRSIRRIIEKISNYEKSFAPNGVNDGSLYFTCDSRGCVRRRGRGKGTYDSLNNILGQQFRAVARAPRHVKEASVLSLLRAIETPGCTIPPLGKLLPNYTKFIADNSDTFLRRIYNAACSIIFNVDPTDRLAIVKTNNQQMSYNEFRLLAQLRNKYCDIHAFYNFAVTLFQRDDKIEDSAPVDMALFSILDILVSYVRNPLHVDSLILTHRKLSSLWKNGSKFLNDYTLHNEDHAICLIRQCVHLCNTIDYLNLKRQDFYPLFLACYLHDISMVIHPNLDDFCKNIPETVEVVTNLVARGELCGCKGNVTRQGVLRAFRAVFEYFERLVRDNHAQDSALYIQKCDGAGFEFIDKSVLSIVAEVGKSHGAAADAVYEEKSEARRSIYSMKYMKILIRLADLMDMCSDRVSFYRMQDMLKAMSPVSRFHWISHLYTESARISTRYRDISHNENKPPIDQHAILETIQVDVFLKAAPWVGYSNSGVCSKCYLMEQSEENMSIESESFTISSEGGFKPAKDICPLSCLWFMKKNKWLLEELLMLKKYLNEVNTRVFKTTFEIRYNCLKEHDVPEDMLDYIKEQL